MKITFIIILIALYNLTTCKKPLDKNYMCGVRKIHSLPRYE